MDITAALLDITGIQRYVFGSNKLKENLGASYLVENIYEKFLSKSANALFSGRTKLDHWKDEHEQERLYIKEDNIEMETAYIGGGNALLLFKDREKAIQFVKEWSRKLLIETPGLATVVAIGKIDPDNPKVGMTTLLNDLNMNKFTYHPQVTLPRHGITTECARTGLSAEHWFEDGGKYISSVAFSKLGHEELAHNMFRNVFSAVMNSYDFPKNIEKLGQSAGESHIAIVHIDGNGIGKRFMECNTISELRGLSGAVSNATKNSMKKLLKCIIDEYSFYKDNYRLEEKTLPIRPIILGGDDVTFVCDARLGIYFAEIFIKAFTEEQVSDAKPLSACAGIAITKTKYPFYRGYELAEDLCRSAKKKAKEEEGSSWFDFHIAYGGFSGEISEIRQRHYTVKEGELCYRPYRLSVSKDDSYDFERCKEGIKKLSRWPKGKQKELRDVLTLGKNATEQFIKEMRYRDHILPDIPESPSFKDIGWDNQETPYFDMLELIEFYPTDKIQGG